MMSPFYIPNSDLVSMICACSNRSIKYKLNESQPSFLNQK